MKSLDQNPLGVYTAEFWTSFLCARNTLLLWLQLTLLLLLLFSTNLSEEIGSHFVRSASAEMPDRLAMQDAPWTLPPGPFQLF